MITVQEFAQKLKNSHKIVFFTGAGISTESGVPDFRSPGGIWSKYQPVYFDEFCSSGEARKRYWQMKKELYDLYKDVQPNLGHKAVARFEKSGNLLGVITQNIDGLHQMGGVSESKVIELHGTDRKIGCLDCGKLFSPDPIFQSLHDDFEPPCCEDCSGFLKSATISFGQPMPQHAMDRATHWTRASDCFVVLGSSLQVEPAASFPAMAHQANICLAIVNNDPTPLDEIADFVYHGKISEFFKTIL